MQNRSSTRKTGLRREFTPFELPDSFPIRFLNRHSPPIDAIDSLHQHDCLELGYCHEGAGVYVIEDKLLPFSAGDATVINDLEMHRSRSAAGAISTWSYILVDPMRMLSTALDERDVLRIGHLGGPAFNNVFDPDRHGGIVGCIRDLVVELESPGPKHGAVVKGLILALMGRLHRLVKEQSPIETQARDAAERVAPALDFLVKRYAESIAVPELARMCYTSESNFRRLFKQATGRGPQEYQICLRVQMAAALLESTRSPIREISERVGFATLSSFNRHFRRIMKTAPRAHRKAPSPQV